MPWSNTLSLNHHSRQEMVRTGLPHCPLLCMYPNHFWVRSRGSGTPSKWKTSSLTSTGSLSQKRLPESPSLTSFTTSFISPFLNQGIQLSTLGVHSLHLQSRCYKNWSYVNSISHQWKKRGSFIWSTVRSSGEEGWINIWPYTDQIIIAKRIQRRYPFLFIK